MSISHGGILAYAMFHHRDTVKSNQHTVMKQRKWFLTYRQSELKKLRKRAKVWNRNNQARYLTQDIKGKVTKSQLDITNESQEVSPFPAGDHKASTNRHALKHNNTIQK